MQTTKNSQFLKAFLHKYRCFSRIRILAELSFIPLLSKYLQSQPCVGVAAVGSTDPRHSSAANQAWRRVGTGPPSYSRHELDEGNRSMEARNIFHTAGSLASSALRSPGLRGSWPVQWPPLPCNRQSGVARCVCVNLASSEVRRRNPSFENYSAIPRNPHQTS